MAHFGYWQGESYFNRFHVQVPSTDVPTSPAYNGDVQRSENDMFLVSRNGAYQLRGNGVESMDQPNGRLISDFTITVDSLQHVFNEYLQEWENHNNSRENPWTPENRWTPGSLYTSTEARTPTSVPPMPPTIGVVAKKKPAKIKKNVSELDVAKAVVKHTKVKAQTLDTKTAMLEAEIAQEEQMLRERFSKFVLSKNRISFFQAQKKRLKKSKNQLVQEFAEEIGELKKLEQIQEITTDSEGRIIVTTNPLSVTKAYWDSPKSAGQYQLRINFSLQDISSGIRVLNITQRANNQYDSPTISGARCCWGNTREDIERDFSSQNLTELIIDMLEYIVSPNEHAGYMGLEGDGSKGWEAFFKDAKQCSEGYSWEEYDKEHESEMFSLPLVEPNGSTASPASFGYITPGLGQPVTTAVFGNALLLRDELSLYATNSPDVIRTSGVGSNAIGMGVAGRSIAGGGGGTGGNDYGGGGGSR